MLIRRLTTLLLFTLGLSQDYQQSSYNDLRASCDDVCNKADSEFTCSICQKNGGRILDKCGFPPDSGSYRCYNSLDTIEVSHLTEGISEYCENNTF